MSSPPLCQGPRKPGRPGDLVHPRRPGRRQGRGVLFIYFTIVFNAIHVFIGSPNGALPSPPGTITARVAPCKAPRHWCVPVPRQDPGFPSRRTPSAGPEAREERRRAGRPGCLWPLLGSRTPGPEAAGRAVGRGRSRASRHRRSRILVLLAAGARPAPRSASPRGLGGRLGRDSRRRLWDARASPGACAPGGRRAREDPRYPFQGLCAGKGGAGRMLRPGTWRARGGRWVESWRRGWRSVLLISPSDTHSVLSMSPN